MSSIGIKNNININNNILNINNIFNRSLTFAYKITIELASYYKSIIYLCRITDLYEIKIDIE